MPKLLVLYGTTDGHTAKVAQALGETLSGEGAECDVVEAKRGGDGPRPEEYAGAVVAASVHAGGYQKAVREWVRAHVAELAERPNAFVSVCLGVLEKDPRTHAELARILERFRLETGWTPREEKTVAGALLYRKYGWLKRWMMKRIVAKAGGDTDTSRDYEYTDWNDLRTFARAFARKVAAA
jgi:menaquinone-dependent protoporphyrinogen oxidase